MNFLTILVYLRLMEYFFHFQLIDPLFYCFHQEFIHIITSFAILMNFIKQCFHIINDFIQKNYIFNLIFVHYLFYLIYLLYFHFHLLFYFKCFMIILKKLLNLQGVRYIHHLPQLLIRSILGLRKYLK